jgi:4'-phosphopantetheinyl transferase
MKRVLKHQLSEGEVHLWLSYPGDITDDRLLDRYLELLGPAEQACYEELLLGTHKREYLISEAFLRDVLAAYGDCQPGSLVFERNASGKPGLVGASDSFFGLQFNLSHTAGLVSCAVSQSAQVGVDVEAYSLDGGMLEVADHYLCAAEMSQLLSLPEAQRPEYFCKLWTLKEAYIKAQGKGLSLSLDEFGFELSDSAGIRLLRQGEPQEGWQFWSLQPLADHLVAVALAASNHTLRIFSGIPLQSNRELTLESLGRVA